MPIFSTVGGSAQLPTDLFRNRTFAPKNQPSSLSPTWPLCGSDSRPTFCAHLAFGGFRFATRPTVFQTQDWERLGPSLPFPRSSRAFAMRPLAAASLTAPLLIFKHHF